MIRSRLTPDQKRSAVLQAILRPAEREQFDALAKARGVSSSNHLRKMILRELRRSGRTEAQEA
jgi:hypothetical protein